MPPRLKLFSSSYEINNYLDLEDVLPPPPNKRGLRAWISSIFTSSKPKKKNERSVSCTNLSTTIGQEEFHLELARRPNTTRDAYITNKPRVHYDWEYAEMLKQEKTSKFEERLNNVPSSQSSGGDYDIIRIIGDGSFETVCLASHRLRGTTHALKYMRCSKSLKREYAEQERDYLYACKSPFLVQMQDHIMIKNEIQLCLVMEHLDGRNLEEQILLHGQLREELCKFYVAQMVLALEYMHNVDLIHRDLKPANIMVTRDDHIKLVDFGCSKQAASTSSYLGTPFYRAPEMTSGHDYYTKAVDWYALGICIYEMLAGAGKTPCAQIGNGYGRKEFVLEGSSKEIQFPKDFSGDFVVRNLIPKLLHNHPASRLGYGESGSEDVRNHPWFDGVNWTAHYKRQVMPPPIKHRKNTRKSLDWKNRN